MRLVGASSYPVGGLEHFYVHGVPNEVALDVGEVMAEGEARHEVAGVGQGGHGRDGRVQDGRVWGTAPHHSRHLQSVLR